ncbi:alpha/beta hydrolase family protein [Actinophytocola sp.]|uniref:alpha/beta hydrolase family protein n=1 Tax=Actinophytocola sp. TaxID=1872138 RepID=UPI0038998A1D
MPTEREEQVVTAEELTYPGHDGPVVATLVRPPGPTSGGVLIAHGGSDDGRRFFLSEARELSEAGLTVLLPVTRLPQHGDIAASAAALRRAVGNARRGVELLAEHTRTDRLCYFGHSGGAATGVLVAAAEPRLSRLVLAGIGNGTVVRVARADLRRAAHPAAEEYLDFLDQYDTRHHIGRFAGRLLIQYGRNDDTVTADEAEQLRAAARPGARWAVYDDGHGLAEPPARRDRKAFLLEP